MDGDLLIFTLTKLTGHAATRFGWALVRDRAVAAAMQAYIHQTVIHDSVDAQVRALGLVRRLVADDGALAEDLFAEIAGVYASRWAAVEAVLAEAGGKASIAVESAPRSPYLLVRCLGAASSGGATCTQRFAEVGVVGYPGDGFGLDGASVVRLSISIPDAEWARFLRAFKALVNPGQ